MFLGQTVGAPQDTKLLAKGSDDLAPRLIATLNVGDSLAFRGCSLVGSPHEDPAHEHQQQQDLKRDKDEDHD